MPCRFRSPTCHLPSLSRLGARHSLWVRVSPSVPSQPPAMRVVLRVQESMGSPKFFDAPLHACHVLMTPAGLQNLTMSIPLRGLLATVRDGRLHLQSAFRGCARPQGGAVSLTAYMVPCVRFRPFVRFVARLSSSRSATLGTGGWLDLTRQGLAPCKKRQACLGAHGSADERRLAVRSMGWFGGLQDAPYSSFTPIT